MLKIKLTEKTTNNNNKIVLESVLKLTKKDIQFLFNKKIIKINNLVKNNKYILIIKFKKKIKNDNIFYLNIFKNNNKKKKHKNKKKKRKKKKKNNKYKKS